MFIYLVIDKSTYTNMIVKMALFRHIRDLGFIGFYWSFLLVIVGILGAPFILARTVRNSRLCCV
jgi:hypothetical protein